jgi:HK97 family phage major capsid protein
MATPGLSPHEMEQRHAEIRDRLDALDAQYRGQQFPEHARAEWNDLNTERDRIRSTLAEVRVRREALREAAADPARQEPTDPPARRADDGVLPRDDPLGQSAEARSAALRVIEQHTRSDTFTPTAADRLERVVRASTLEARYVAAVGSPHYKRAFGKLIVHGPHDAYLRMTPQEHESVRNVTTAEEQRALSEGTGPTGGFGVPVDIDPTILLSSNGAINPIRQLARVFTTTTSKWTGVSGAMTAAYALEAAEATDQAPTLSQPVVNIQKAHTFCPFSIEVGVDYANLQNEIARLIADAKDVLEAQAFLTGAARHRTLLASSARPG